MLEKISRVVLLNDFYGPLLTEKQQEILSLHFENDLSLTEIADQMQTSRQAVFDMVKRAEAQLEDFEKKLGMAEKYLLTRRRLGEVVVLLEKPDPRPEDAVEAIKMVHEIMDLL